MPETTIEEGTNLPTAEVNTSVTVTPAFIDPIQEGTSLSVSDADSSINATVESTTPHEPNSGAEVEALWISVWAWVGQANWKQFETTPEQSKQVFDTVAAGWTLSEWLENAWIIESDSNKSSEEVVSNGPNMMSPPDETPVAKFVEGQGNVPLSAE